MSGPGDREDRWANMARTAFLLDEQSATDPRASPEARRTRVVAALHSLLEVFPASVDPLDDFEGYAVRRLVASMERALGEPQGSAVRLGDDQTSGASSADGH